LGLGPGDGVITTPFTFFATAGTIVRIGARPVFVDIDPVTFNMDVDALEELLENGDFPAPPKAIMPIHLFGQVSDMTPLRASAERHGLLVIEDAAQAIGAQYPDRRNGGFKRAGAMGDMGCFSFFPSKNLGAFGEGGLVTCRDEELAATLKMLRNHGSSPREKYENLLVGGNFRLDALQAAVLNVKLKHLDGWSTARRLNAERYNGMFKELPGLAEQGAVQTPEAVWRDSGAEHYHIYNQYVIRAKDRDALQSHVKAAGIGTAVYYPLPLHLQKCFRSLGYREGQFPVSEQAAREVLALPVYPELTEAQQEYVVETIAGFQIERNY